LELKRTLQLLVYVHRVNLLEENINIIKKNTQGSLHASKQIGIEINISREIFSARSLLVVLMMEAVSAFETSASFI
jgi:hypothetical protein